MKYMRQIISKLSQLLCLLKRYENCQRRVQGLCSSEDINNYLDHLLCLSDSLIDRFESLPCVNCNTKMSLEDLLGTYGRSVKSIKEGANGYHFPMRMAGSKEVFITYPRTKYVSDDSGNLTIESDGETLIELNEASRKGKVQRRIYVPDESGQYISCGDFVYDSQKSIDANAEVWISVIVLQHNGWQRYDKMFIIDSLADDDDTAMNLEKQVSAYTYLGTEFCQRLKATTAEQWDFAMDKIIQSASHQSVPIVHLEMHGDDDGNLKVNGNIVIPVAEFLTKMEEVSKRCNAKVLVTLAVCSGLKFYESMSKDFNKLPCSYVIGSCHPIQSGNIAKRYGAFYKELLQDSTTRVDIRRAFAKMQSVYKDAPSDRDYYKDQKFVMITDGQIFN